MRVPAVDQRLTALARAGEIATCGVIELEVLYSARTHKDLVQIRKERQAAFPSIDITQADFDRAMEVMELLARRGQHRAASIPDLLIAAVAQRSDLTILHYDHDFETIATVTSQKTEWVVARGSVA